MPRKLTFVSLGLLLSLLAACSSSASPSTVATGTLVPTSTPALSTAAPLASSTTLPTGVPTALDPCQLVTSAEASQIGGTSYGTGVEGTTSGNGKTCVYHAQGLNVFTVIVGQAPDVATAQAGKAAAEAAFQKLAAKGITFIELPNFADGAAYYAGNTTISGQAVGIGAMYVLKGTIFFGFSSLGLGHAASTSAALQAQAQTILGRLP